MMSPLLERLLGSVPDLRRRRWFYDHVPPPEACVPDATPPMLGTGTPFAPVTITRFRVPFVAVSLGRKSTTSRTTRMTHFDPEIH